MSEPLHCEVCDTELGAKTQLGLCPICQLKYAATIGPTVDSGNQGTIPSSGESVKYFGDYVLIEEIARGGMGVVFKAEQVSLHRIVALKMILAGQLASEEDVKRFQMEAEAAASLDHSGIVPIYEIGEQEGQHFFSMKLIEGSSLAKEVPRFVQNQRAAAKLVSLLAEAVHHAHQRGIIHRDLKPANVLMDQDGKPHITDFGLARRFEGGSELTQTGAVLGTPSYMSPEQARGEKRLTTAADVYSLGAIFYELLTGQAPFRATSALQIVLQVLNEEPKSIRAINPQIDRDLEYICLKCLSKVPEARYSSAAGLMSDLEHWLAGEPISIRTPSVTELTRVWLRQNFGAAGRTVIVGLGFGIAFGTLIWNATVQNDVAEWTKYYNWLPSQKKPWLLYFAWQVPDWFQLVCLALSFFIVTYLGLVTVMLVRPKNRNADFVTGLVTSLVAGLATFVFGLGPMGIIASNEFDDMNLLGRVAYTNSDVVTQELIKKYPDLAQVSDRQRAEILFGKITADRSANIRKGLWGSLLFSIALFLFIGLGETMAAGPLIRNHRWYAAMILYTEMALSLAALSLVGCVYAIAPLLLSFPIGFFGWWKLLTMIGAIILGFWSAVLQWKWQFRVVIQAIGLSCFFNYLVNDFPHTPSVGHFQTLIADAKRLVDRDSENQQYRLDLGEKYAYLGNYWKGYQRWSDVIGPYEQAFAVYKSIQTPELTPEAQARMNSLLPPMIETYDRLGRSRDAEALLKMTITKLIDLDQKRRMGRLLRVHCKTMVAAGISSASACETFLRSFVREKLQSGVSEVDDERVDRIAAWITVPVKWKIAGPFPGSQDANGITTPYPPELDVEFKEQYESAKGIIRTKEVNIDAGDYVDLLTIMPKAEFVVGYASTIIESSREQDAFLSLGSDDGCKVWLNGNLVAEVQEPRPYREGSEQIPVTLRKGSNRILIKVDQRKFNWGFSMDVIDANAWPASSLRPQ